MKAVAFVVAALLLSSCANGHPTKANTTPARSATTPATAPQPVREVGGQGVTVVVHVLPSVSVDDMAAYFARFRAPMLQDDRADYANKTLTFDLVPSATPTDVANLRALLRSSGLFSDA